MAKLSTLNSYAERRHTIKFLQKFLDIWAQKNEIYERNLGAARAKLWPTALEDNRELQPASQGQGSVAAVGFGQRSATSGQRIVKRGCGG